jgi:hypothetical protein
MTTSFFALLERRSRQTGATPVRIMNSEGWFRRSSGVSGAPFASRYAEPANRSHGAGVSARCTSVESGSGSEWALIATS